MGQQQLLLLVLATVIVGLATVAGIQAFDENQSQAAQDALVQKGTAIGSDVIAAANKPSQFNGLHLNGPSNSGEEDGDVADAIGVSDPVDVDGAGDSGQCDIKDPSSGTVVINCTADDAQQGVWIEVDPSADGTEQVDTQFGSSDPFSA